MIPRIAILGRNRVGKDFVADGTTIPKRGLGEPLYKIAGALLGNATKRDLGFRKFLQQIGQISRNIVSEQYPICIERASLIDMVRRYGPTIPSLGWVDWASYGKDPHFLVNLLLQDLALKGNPPVVVNDLRDPSDRRVLEANGFTCYLVLSSDKTRYERMVSLGEAFDGVERVANQGIPEDGPWSKSTHWEKLLSEEERTIDYSEQYSAPLSNRFLYTSIMGRPEFDTDKVIWNDHREPTRLSLLYEDKSYLSTAQFHSRFKDLMEEIPH